MSYRLGSRETGCTKCGGVRTTVGLSVVVWQFLHIRFFCRGMVYAAPMASAQAPLSISPGCAQLVLIGRLLCPPWPVEPHRGTRRTGKARCALSPHRF